MMENDNESRSDFIDRFTNLVANLKAPKNQYNSHGKYKYRSAEDILEAIKPLSLEYGVCFHVTEKIKEVGGFVFVECEARCNDVNTEISIASIGNAIIELDAKGMHMPQRTGSASSYAKKYALGNLLLLDDTRDSDATNDHNGGGAKKVLQPNSAEYKQAEKFLQNGGDIKKVESKFTLTSQVKKELEKHLKTE